MVEIRRVPYLDQDPSATPYQTAQTACLKF